MYGCGHWPWVSDGMSSVAGGRATKRPRLREGLGLSPLAPQKRGKNSIRVQEALEVTRTIACRAELWNGTSKKRAGQSRFPYICMSIRLTMNSCLGWRNDYVRVWPLAMSMCKGRRVADSARRGLDRKLVQSFILLFSEHDSPFLSPTTTP